MKRWDDSHAALVPCEESTDAMFTALRVEDGFARWLVESGRLDRDTFRRLWAEYESGEPQLYEGKFRIGRLLPQLEQV